jgi:hypothetical protein
MLGGSKVVDHVATSNGRSQTTCIADRYRSNIDTGYSQLLLAERFYVRVCLPQGHDFESSFTAP